MPRLAQLAKWLVLLLGLAMSGYLLWLKLSSSGYMTMTTSEAIQLYRLNGWDYLLVVLVGLVWLCLLYLSQFLPIKWLVALGALTYLALGAYLITGVDPVPRSDPRYVWEAALALNKGDWITFAQDGLKSYLSIFPNQLGLVSVFRVFARWSTDIRLIWGLQLLLILVNQLLLAGITQRLFGNARVTKAVLVLSFLFLPSLFLMLWAYGDILGLTGVLLAAYCLLLAESKGYCLPLLVSAALSLGLAISVRSNYAIMVLAMIAVYVLKWLQRPSWWPVLCNLFLALSLLAPSPILNHHYESLLGRALPQGTPLKAWVVMGLNDQAANPGYWDGYTTLLPIWYHFDQEEMAERIDQDFSERWQRLTREPVYREQFFQKKLQVTWNEPTYQSIYTGPLKARQQEARQPLLKSLYEEGWLYQLYHDYSKALSLLITAGFALALLYQAYGLIKGDILSPWTYWMTICFIGGFLFHLFWETKSRYVYPFVYLSLPQVAWISQLILSSLGERWSQLKKEEK